MIAIPVICRVNFHVYYLVTYLSLSLSLSPIGLSVENDTEMSLRLSNTHEKF